MNRVEWVGLVHVKNEKRLKVGLRVFKGTKSSSGGSWVSSRHFLPASVSARTIVPTIVFPALFHLFQRSNLTNNIFVFVTSSCVSINPLQSKLCNRLKIVCDLNSKNEWTQKSSEAWNYLRNCDCFRKSGVGQLLERCTIVRLWSWLRGDKTSTTLNVLRPQQASCINSRLIQGAVQWEG